MCSVSIYFFLKHLLLLNRHKHIGLRSNTQTHARKGTKAYWSEKVMKSVYDRKLEGINKKRPKSKLERMKDLKPNQIKPIEKKKETTGRI